MLSNSKMYPEFFNFIFQRKNGIFFVFWCISCIECRFSITEKRNRQKKDSVLQRFVLTKKECLVIKIQFDTHSIFFYFSVDHLSGTKN